MKQLSLTLFFAALATFSFAQKASVTDAHNAYKRYVPLVGDLETNKKALADAKAAIDLAAVNTETANALDMHKYRGMVYYGLMETAAVEGAMSGKEADTAALSSYEKVVKASFTAVLNAPKGKGEKAEVREFINLKTTFYFNNGLAMFNAKKYSEATMMFLGAFKISQLINEPYNDAAVNTKLSFARAVDTLLDTKNYEEADKLGRMVCEEFPKDLDVLVSLINLNLQKNDLVEAEKFLKNAISIDSTNKQLLLVLGSSLMELKQYEKASESFNKSLKLDPNYSEAVYQYSTMLFNWSIELRNTAADLKPSDPKAKELEKKANRNLTENGLLLENYLKNNANDTIALEITWRTYSFLPNDAKYFEYKTRWFTVRDSIMKNKLNENPNDASVVYFNFKVLCDWAKFCHSSAEENELDEIKANYMAQYEQIKKNTSEAIDKLIEKKPTDKIILEIGWKTYSMLGNEEKKKELKARWEAIK
jgi:tetratricopeptide (TPR) repeat protein